MRLPGLRQVHDVVLGLRPTSRDQAGQRIAQIAFGILQEGFEFSFQIWYGPRIILKQIEQLPLPTRKPSLAELTFELLVDEHGPTSSASSRSAFQR